MHPSPFEGVAWCHLPRRRPSRTRTPRLDPRRTVHWMLRSSRSHALGTQIRSPFGRSKAAMQRYPTEHTFWKRRDPALTLFLFFLKGKAKARIFGPGRSPLPAASRRKFRSAPRSKRVLTMERLSGVPLVDLDRIRRGVSGPRGSIRSRSRAHASNSWPK